MEKIEILDKYTNTKATYVLQNDTEEKESYNPYIVYTKALLRLLIKLTIKLARFSLYVVISFLKKFIAIVERLFLNDYKPLSRVTEAKNSILDKRAKENINKYEIQFASQLLSRHEYNFQKSEQFLAQYKYLQNELKQMADNEIPINADIYKDIFKRVSIIVSEAENVALREGYKYAKETKYKLLDEEIYNDFIRDKVLSGQSNTDWKNLKERLNNE